MRWWRRAAGRQRRRFPACRGGGSRGRVCRASAVLRGGDAVEQHCDELRRAHVLFGAEHLVGVGEDEPAQQDRRLLGGDGELVLVARQELGEGCGDGGHGVLGDAVRFRAGFAVVGHGAGHADQCGGLLVAGGEDAGGRGELVFERAVGVDRIERGQDRLRVERLADGGMEQGVLVGEDPEDGAFCDPGRLRQVFSNLLANSIHHTPPGGEIVVSSAIEGEQIVLTIRDSGEGIAPEHLPLMFDRFYRADTSRTRDTGGSGLGLAIVKALVEIHQGKVLAESAGHNKGSTFTVRLPMQLTS